ncbi:AAA family ATPase [Corynebacterium matruchotii]|uniref:AAA family ATPase n=1 Tax=Corynebacterium matruchotii TaxID=43768 RepID=UPI003C75120F
MLITDIEIRDFKTIRHLRWSNIPDHGVFVIHGDNEQGKSTVLEAIAQVLHTKHSSRAQAVKDTQPLGSDVGPQVTVNLTLGGKNVRLFKQWLKTPRAELTISGDGSYTGGDAEQRFEEFFHKYVDQTLFTALYNRQGSMVHPLVLGGITSLTQVLAEASGVSEVGNSGHAQTRDAETGPLLARIIGEYHKYYTQRGKPTKQFQAHHDRVAAGRELPGQREIRDACHEDYEAARQIQHQAEQLDRDQEQARVRLQAAEAALAKRLELVESEQAGRERVDKLEAALVDLRQAAEAEDERSATLTAARAAAVAAEQQAHDAVRAATATRDAAASQQRRAELEKLRRALDDIAAQRRALVAVPKVAAATVTRYETAESAVRLARHTHELRAPKLAVQAPAATKLTLNGEPADAEFEHVVADTTILTVGDATITITPGAGDTETHDAVAQAEADLADLIAKHGFATLAEARAARTAYTEAQSALKLLVTQHDVLLGELSLDELDAALDAEPVEVDVTLAEAEAAVTSASQALAAAVTDREQADAALVSLADRPAAQALAVHEAVLADAREAARVTTEQLEQVVDSPSLDELRADCATERDALDEVTAARDEIAEQLKQAAPTAKKQLYEAAQAHVEYLENHVRDAATSIAEHRSYIEASVGAAEDHDRLQVEKVSAERRLAAETRRAQAAKLLYETVVRHQRAAHARYAQPFVDELSRLAQPVFGSGVQFVLDDTLKLTQRVSAVGEHMNVRQLSGGAQEQLEILTRFAIASLVSDAQVPVFFDDVLGSSDARRLMAMGAVFAEMGKQRQVFVLTCAPERYAAVSGRVERPLRGLQLFDD